jgi:hypothetical protein
VVEESAAGGLDNDLLGKLLGGGLFVQLGDQINIDPTLE